MKIAAFLLQLLLLVVSTSALHLTTENIESSAAGKTMFVKFYAPWCGHCKKLAPDWDKLTSDFASSASVLVAEVDCTSASGKPLCTASGVKGYPTLKWGQNGEELKDYKGARNYAGMKKFAEEELKPSCSVDNVDLCDDAMKGKIKDWQKADAKELDALIWKLEVSCEYDDNSTTQATRRQHLENEADETHRLTHTHTPLTYAMLLFRHTTGQSVRCK